MLLWVLKLIFKMFKKNNKQTSKAKKLIKIKKTLTKNKNKHAIFQFQFVNVLLKDTTHYEYQCNF